MFAHHSAPFEERVEASADAEIEEAPIMGLCFGFQDRDEFFVGEMIGACHDCLLALKPLLLPVVWGRAPSLPAIGSALRRSTSRSYFDPAGPACGRSLRDGMIGSGSWRGRVSH